MAFFLRSHLALPVSGALLLSAGQRASVAAKKEEGRDHYGRLYIHKTTRD